MSRIDEYYGAVLALLAGFLVSAGMVGFVLSAGGYYLPTIGPAGPAVVAGPGVSRLPHRVSPRRRQRQPPPRSPPR